jgi:hypothetical protein
MSHFGCGSQVAPTPAAPAPVAPAFSASTPAASELLSCKKDLSMAQVRQTESDGLLRQCHLELASRALQSKEQTAQPAVAPKPGGEGGWWCVETLADHMGSNCSRTWDQCQVLASEIRSKTQMVPGQCEWQPRAACFVLHAKLSDTTDEICSSLLSTCDAYRDTRRKQTRDYGVRSLCRATN